ncbi:MAG: TonB-dependent receptor [Bacteroidota bacterium]
MRRLYFSKSLILLLSLSFSISSMAQTPTQTIRGTIKDAINTQILIGASVKVVNQDNATTTDAEGTFRLEKVEVGRQQLQVSYIGYESIILPVLVESGKEVVLNIELNASQTGLDTVVVKSPRLGVVHPLSTQTITIEETFRYPATFYDPARMMTLYPGVANVNNQSNAISVRGNSPNFNQWRLEGVEIVNPNHTPNAGTFSDRITQSAGGVNILSAQLLDYSSFLTSAYPAQYGNALGGILDMKLRKGNDEQHEFVGQIGLIGLDVAAEGPISKKSKASYLVNYRYSTIGLLSDLGVDVGDEDISFQDFSLNLSFPTKKVGDFTLFGVWGASDNVFITDRDSTLWEENKDQFDIIFDSRTVIAGGTHSIRVGERGFWKTSLAFSELRSNRTSTFVPSATLSSSDQQKIQKTSLHTYYSNQISGQSNLRVGVTTTNHDFNVQLEPEEPLASINIDRSGILVQPYVSWQNQFSNGLNLNLGLTYSHFSLSKSNAVEPRVTLDYRLKSDQRISLTYGLHSQTQIPELYEPRLCFSGGSCDRNLLNLTKAHHFVLGYQRQFSSTTTLGIEAYYQYLFDVPVSTFSTASAINFLEIDRFYDLENGGNGRNVGVELNFQKILTDNYYILANATVFDSRYDLDSPFGSGLDTRWNGNYIFNFTGGKEWKKQKETQQRIFGVNLNIAYLGGFREQQVNLAFSKSEERTIFSGSRFTQNQADYFKTDLRLYLKRNKAKYNTTLALDIQNATNQQNVAFNYYDVIQDAVVTKYQLGLIPILTWRIEW